MNTLAVVYIFTDFTLLAEPLGWIQRNLRTPQQKNVGPPPNMKHETCLCYNDHLFKSRSEQAPGIVFHPCDKIKKIDWDLRRPFWCNINIDPER